NIPNEVDYDACLKLLITLYDYYNWRDEESKGKRRLGKNKKVLSYYAVLMNSWINSKPLNLIIKDIIKYYVSNKKDILLGNNFYEPFDPSNRNHINKVVNNAVSDIENVLRFKVKNYVSNYILLTNKIQEYDRLPGKIDWSEYLEYGTNDKIIIELQNLGFPRHLATFIKKNYIQFFIIEDNVITDFREIELKKHFNKVLHNEEYVELAEILDWKI
ncbi:helicase, partial [Bacillus clausii]|nr:helicase [Shouchella clausii]